MPVRQPVLSHSPEAHQNFVGSAPELCSGAHQKSCDLEGVEGGSTPKHSLLKTMTTFRKFNKVTTAVLCAGLIGATTGALAPAAEAKHHHHNHHELRRIRRQIRRDVRDFNHYQRAYNRDWRRARRVYNRYPRVIAPYGYRYGYGYGYRQPGLGVQFRF